MGKYFFYTDPTKLGANKNASGEPGSYGPIDQSLAQQGHDEYRLTNVHQGIAAPAIAVCDGTILIQEDGSATGPDQTITIVLKPDYQPNIKFPSIQYFYYRGVLLSSVLEQNGLALKDVSSAAPNLPFVSRIKAGWKVDFGDIAQKSAALTGIKFTDTATIPSLGRIFRNAMHLDNYFLAPLPFTKVSVKAGEAIGVFSDTFVGFEIELKRLGYYPSFAHARKREAILSVPSISDPLNVSDTHLPDDLAFFNHWLEKEKCLSFIDPCAFYGTLSTHELYWNEEGLGKKKSNSIDETSASILSKFDNQFAVYFDLRNNKNRSLNYAVASKLKENIYFLDANSNVLAVHNLRESDWPILRISAPQHPNIFTHSAAFVSISAENDSNVCIYQSTHYRPTRRSKRIPNWGYPDISGGKTEPVKLVLPHSQSTPSAFYQLLRISTFDEDVSEPFLVSDKNAISNLFDIYSLIRSLSPILIQQTIVFDEEVIVRNFGKYNLSFIAYIGISYDGNRLHVFAVPKTFLSIPEYANITNLRYSTSGFLRSVTPHLDLFPQTEILKNTSDSTYLTIPVRRDGYKNRRVADAICGQADAKSSEPWIDKNEEIQSKIFEDATILLTFGYQKFDMLKSVLLGNTIVFDSISASDPVEFTDPSLGRYKQITFDCKYYVAGATGIEMSNGLSFNCSIGV